MAMRKTPFLRMRYPWTSDVVAASDVVSMAADIDQTLVQTQQQAQNFSLMGSALVQRAATQSITKATLTAITMDTVQLNNGADSPLANGSWWNAANPTRLTAPAPCIVLASASGGFNFTAALGTAGCLQVTIALNGATGAPNVQGSKFSPISTATGQMWGQAASLWKLAAGDFLELKMFWTGTPAGPFVTDIAFPPTLSVAMVGLPQVP